MTVQIPHITAVDCLLLSVFSYLLLALRDYRRRRGIPYPPGPRPWPIIGNLLDAPKQSPWAAYADMSKKYGLDVTIVETLPFLLKGLSGDVMCLQMFGEVVVVLCSLSAVKDLLEKRGERYSNRPVLPVHQMCA